MLQPIVKDFFHQKQHQHFLDESPSHLKNFSQSFISGSLREGRTQFFGKFKLDCFFDCVNFCRLDMPIL